MADANSDNNQGGTPGDPSAGSGVDDGQGQDALTFDGWLGQQPDNVKGLIQDHIAGLKSALQAERDQRKELAKELKTASKALDEDSQAREALDELSGKFEAIERKNAFYELATEAGMQNLKLGWLAAQESGAISKSGLVKMESLKADYPELFKKSSPPPANAGAGTGNKPPGGKVDMDALIRQTAGLGQLGE